MPASRLQQLPVTIRKFDAVGEDSDTVVEFVRHVGLAMRDQNGITRTASSVFLVEMGPPLALDGAGTAHTFGTAELNASDLLQIQVFVDELTSEYEAERARPKRQYVIRPHATEPDEQFPFRRFNCAGFVVEAYKYAGIELVEVDEARLPLVSLQTLMQAYPDVIYKLEDERFRTLMGIPGPGPWPVLCAGHVINALARNADQVRSVAYSANHGDEYFPTRQLQPAAPAMPLEALEQ